MSRAYRRDRRGRFAATPGQKVTAALGEAQAALNRAEQGVEEIAASKRATTKRDRRTVRRSALAGAAVGAAIPAPASVKVSAATTNAFVAGTSAAGYKIGKAVGAAKISRRSAAGTRLRR
ncbi:hypothetical protein ACWDTI_25350 [Gordonia sp. NPDC003424]